jgi:hypothetical protein
VTVCFNAESIRSTPESAIHAILQVPSGCKQLTKL